MGALSRRTWTSVTAWFSALALLALLAALLFACHANSDDVLNNQLAVQLLKEKKYAEAEPIFQALISRLESKLKDSATGDTKARKQPLSLLLNQEKQEGKMLAVACNNLATALYESGKYAEAESAYEKAIHTYRQYFGKQHHFVMDCLNKLAATYYKQGKYIDAERYYLEGLELEKQLLKPGSLEIAVTANNLAAIYQKLGDDEEAEKYFQYALDLCEKFKSSDREKHKLADILNNMAVFYERNGEYDDAKDLVSRALELEESQNNEDFLIDKARSHMVLASIHKAGLDLDASEQHYQKALALIYHVPEGTLLHFGGRADLASEIMAKYAELLLGQRKFKEAEPLFERSLNASIEAHGEEHPATAERLSEYAILMRRTERYSRAESMLRRALAIQEKTIGIDTVAYLTTLHRLASVLDDQKRTGEADKIYADTLPKLKERLGPYHPFIADSMDNWAGYAEKFRGKEDAEELRASARVIRRKIAHSLSPVYDTEKRQ